MRSLPYTLLLTLLLITAGHALDLDSLLVKSVGGQTAYDSLRVMTSYSAKGTVSINGTPGTFTELFVPPWNFYLEIDLGAFTITQACDGRDYWQRDQNGSVTSVNGVELKNLIEQVYFESYAYLFPERMPGFIRFAGDSTYQGSPCHMVDIAPAGGDTVRVYFDAATGLRHAVVSYLDNTEVSTALDDYRSIQGVLIPFLSSAVSVGAPLSSIFRITQAQFNAPVDTALFRRPGNVAQDFLFPDEQSRLRIPFTIRNGQIYVPVTLNGSTRLVLILDSGASSNIFHDPAIAPLNLPQVASQHAKGVTDWKEVALIRVDSLAIGSLRLFNQIGGRMNLDGIGSDDPSGVSFGGLLGYDFLSRFPVMIDYPDSSLVVFDPDTFVPPAGGIEIPFHLTLQVPTVKASVNGVPGDFIIDLGNAFGLILHQAFSTKPEIMKSLRNRERVSATLSGIGGGLNAKPFTVDSLVIGDRLHVTGVQAMATESTSGMAGSADLAGNIGNQVLRSFKVLFDYSHERLFFYPADTNP